MLSTPSQIQRIAKLKAILQKRATLLSAIREFFKNESFLELETPVLLDAPLPESHIEAISAENGILRTSHEAYLKACLAAGYDKIFEIGSCFRKEEIGRYHREEFTMLEWYQTGAKSEDLIPFTKKLIIHCARAINCETKIIRNEKIIELDCVWEIISLKDAFAKFADHSMEYSVINACFEKDLIEKIEPKLPSDKPCILKDYPAKFRAYSKLKDDDSSICDRWELYIGGIEIANTYTECTDECEIRKLIAQFSEERKNAGMKNFECSKTFLEAIEAGIPASAGSALGIDRLLMLLSSAKSIEDVKI